VAEAPDQLTLERHRDGVGRERRPLTRRILIGVVTLTLVLALLNVFGQRPRTSEAASQAAKLSLYSPPRLRSGLIYETRFDVHALHDLKEATLVLDPGWLEGMTLNTVEPSPVGEASRNGRLAFDLGHIPAGRRHLLFLQFSVNPTNVGRRSQRVDLYDGTKLLLTIHRRVTVWP